MRAAVLTAMVVLVSAVAPDAFAQKYPTKPIRLIAPFPPGGGTDILSRVIAVPLTRSLGQPVVVDNRPGAGGAVGAELAARAEPDGYSLVLVSSSYAATAAYHKVPYDPVNGIQPVILIGTTGLVMFVHPSLPAKSVKELIDYAKANPGKVNYATVGIGSVTHLAHEQFRLMTGINIVHIPYKGGGPATAALASGDVQVMQASPAPLMPHYKSGRVRVLAYTGDKRHPVAPEIPTTAEAGLPQYRHDGGWFGMFAPAATPAEVLD
ncbi:MAG: Bug family tripartite tricarboxylate transporter substrate binding protein, partial [Terriglobales bacterium]